MRDVVVAIIGGLVAVVPVAVAAGWAWRSESRQRREERHLELSRNALSALQQLVRATINVAYAHLPPRQVDLVDTPEQTAVRTAFERAVTEWNAAMYGVLVGADPAVGANVRAIDRELDRLTGQALSQQWDRAAFRAERVRLGQLMAEHVAVVRKQAGLSPIDLPTIWTWDVA